MRFRLRLRVRPSFRFLLAALALPVALPLSSCTSTDPEETTRKPVPPPNTSSQMPWNKPIAGQGGGALSAMPNTPRR